MKISLYFFCPSSLQVEKVDYHSFAVLNTTPYYASMYEGGNFMLTVLKHVFPKASISKLAILSHEKIEQVFCIFAIIATWLPSAFNLERLLVH